ncbi:MAG: (2Fe-2S) ferredoxin domain-containing protein [Acaryochloris sp. RU_4_1]|nr:(2Fe-2S) ferredoxin domain-containing protein [Acaryochloris sp. SU_5_25]NJM68607.1 (2Fe-2S) ferredoxin domain-containing protein [Acaryochloris sp. RU_4_1]NJR54314.1 (2Fe-2S) ferredoxin domain-containing protein [Acaryochloris sp. CRU_2_0]
MGKHIQKTDFTLCGRFVTYILSKSCQVKGIRLTTAQGEQYIKLAKSLRPACSDVLQPGTWIQIHGCQTQNTKTGKIKLKAQAIVPALPSIDAKPADSSDLSDPSEQSLACPHKGKIRICQKSSCRKRGSQKILTALSGAIQASGREKEIQVQSMGCVGKCKAGPNLIVFPDKTRYVRVKPQNITTILQQHF